MRFIELFVFWSKLQLCTRYTISTFLSTQTQGEGTRGAGQGSQGGGGGEGGGGGG